MELLQIGDITVELVMKDIRNVHLSVYPPAGHVRLSAPLHMNKEALRLYMITKIGWIRAQQRKFAAQERETAREYLNKERHYFLGRRYLLKVVEGQGPARIELRHSELVMYVHPGARQSKKQEILEEWYRRELAALLERMVAKWEKKIGVMADEIRIKKMQTKWGTCNAEAKRIWINLELAKKPVQCIEYILVHELVHLLERNHNERFMMYMDQFLPGWKHARTELNRLPVSHRDWVY